MRSARVGTRVVFGAGVALGLLMALRAQVGLDQYRLLIGGWLLADKGLLLPFGNPMSGGGYEPGGVTNLLVGLPLLVWRDHRAVGLSILGLHILGYWLLDRMVRRLLSPNERVLFALLYWLNPWRLYFSAHLWNPNYLFLLGALHTWTAYRQRQRGAFWPSFLHVTAVGLAFQLHGSFLILAVASVLLFATGLMRVNWPGAVCGAALVVASLVPWMHLAAQHPEILPAQEGFLGRGLITVYPLVRGIGYWVRYPSLFFGRQMIRLDFTPALGSAADGSVGPAMTALARYVAPLSTLPVVAANVRLWKGVFTRRLARRGAAVTGRAWLSRLALWYFVASVLSFALSPTTIMMWQGFIVMHAAVLPVVLYFGPRIRRGVGVPFKTAAAAWVLGLVLLALSFAVAAPMYRTGGRQAVKVKASTMPEMVKELAIAESATFVLSAAAPPHDGPRLNDCDHASHAGILRLLPHTGQ